MVSTAECSTAILSGICSSWPERRCIFLRCFGMPSESPRVTRSAGGVVTNANGEVLVVNQRGTSWSLPKGHIEEGEEALEAARREIYEESGLTDLALIKPLGTYRRSRI